MHAVALAMGAPSEFPITLPDAVARTDTPGAVSDPASFALRAGVEPHAIVVPEEKTQRAIQFRHSIVDDIIAKNSLRMKIPAQVPGSSGGTPQILEGREDGAPGLMP